MEKVVKVGYHSLKLEEFLSEYAECTKENVEQIMSYYPFVKMTDEGSDLVFTTFDNEAIGNIAFNYGVAKTKDLSDIIAKLEWDKKADIGEGRVAIGTFKNSENEKLITIGSEAIRIEDFLEFCYECTTKEVEQVLNYYPEINTTFVDDHINFSNDYGIEIGHLFLEDGLARVSELKFILEEFENQELAVENTR